MPGHNAPNNLKLLNFGVYLILVLFSAGPAFNQLYQRLFELSKLALLHDRNWLLQPAEHPEKAKVAVRAIFCNSCLQVFFYSRWRLCGNRNLGSTSRFLFHLLHLFICICVHVHMCHSTHVDIRGHFEGSQFSPFHHVDSGFKLRSSSLAVGILPTEPSMPRTPNLTNWWHMWSLGCSTQ